MDADASAADGAEERGAVAGYPLPWRPGHGPAARHVQMDLEHRLPGVGVAAEHQPIAARVEAARGGTSRADVRSVLADAVLTIPEDAIRDAGRRVV